MAGGTFVLRFGPFAFDPVARRLYRDGQLIELADAYAKVLLRLLSAPGEVVPKDALFEAGWDGRELEESSLGQAIRRIRLALTDATGTIYIETAIGEGYRFIVPVTRVEVAAPVEALDALIGPFRTFAETRARIDALDYRGIREARPRLEAAIAQAPDYAEGYVIGAVACALGYDASLVGAQPDTPALLQGLEWAREACRRNAASPDAWAAYAYLQDLNGDREASAAAACRAMSLNLQDVRFLLQIARAGWGELRLTPAHRVLDADPGSALGYWLCGTVFIARQNREEAYKYVRLGCAAQDRQLPGAPLNAVGCHLLEADLLAVDDRLDEAEKAVRREIKGLRTGHLHERECHTHALYELGGIQFRQGRRDEAAASWSEALTIWPGHYASAAVLRGEVLPSLSPPDAAFARALILKRGNREDDAAQMYLQGLRLAPAGPAGWGLWVDPILHPSARPHIWAAVLDAVRRRAM